MLQKIVQIKYLIPVTTIIYPIQTLTIFCQKRHLKFVNNIALASAINSN